MGRRRDFELWREVNKTVHRFNIRGRDLRQAVRRTDRLELAREMIEHADELAARAERQTDEVAIARLEGQVQGWRDAAARLRTRRT